FVLRLQDLWHRDALKLVIQPRVETWFFLFELFAGVLIPAALLFRARVRRSAGWLFAAASLVILGFMTNRLNVSIIGMWDSAGVRYIPKWSEVAVSALIVVTGVMIFGVAAKRLPVFPEKAART
ncbi:MAG: NrfD/PsrC family molybdoenzyme membrane anchor subunit, partial [Candidatus Acidiferrales bacterium]